MSASGTGFLKAKRRGGRGTLLTIVRQTSKDVIVKVDIFLGRFIILTTFSITFYVYTEQLVHRVPRLHPKINGITSSSDTTLTAG